VTRPFLPSAEARAAAAEWLVGVVAGWPDHGQLDLLQPGHRRPPTPGQILEACGIDWPHPWDPTHGDVVAVLAAWWDLHRANLLRPAGRGPSLPVYRHDDRVISFPMLRSAA
jgi:hypothetical protein